MKRWMFSLGISLPSDVSIKKSDSAIIVFVCSLFA